MVKLQASQQVRIVTVSCLQAICLCIWLSACECVANAVFMCCCTHQHMYYREGRRDTAHDWECSTKAHAL